REANTELERRVEERTRQFQAVNHNLQAEILDRRRAQESLRQTSESMAAIVTNAGEGIITFDEDGVVESCNQAARDIFRYEPGEVVGRNVQMVLPSPGAEGQEDFRGQLLAAVTSSLGSWREMVGRRKDGSPFPMEVIVNELREDDRRLFIGIVRDISER